MWVCCGVCVVFVFLCCSFVCVCFLYVVGDGWGGLLLVDWFVSSCLVA